MPRLTPPTTIEMVIAMNTIWYSTALVPVAVCSKYSEGLRVKPLSIASSV